MFAFNIYQRYKYNTTINKRPKDLNGHLSIRDSTLTSCEKSSLIFAYHLLHHRINKSPQWHRKAALHALNTIAINVMYIDRAEDNAYLL